MAKEFEVYCFLLPSFCGSQKGRRLLRSAKTGNVSRLSVDDWTMLVETLLGWVQWLKGDKILRKHVKASEWKHRYLMYLYKR
jgi:hypothetical protein